MTRKPILYILSGIPGSGKSTYCKEWRKFYGYYGYRDWREIISRDWIRQSRFPQPYTYSKWNEAEVSRVFNDQLRRYAGYEHDIAIDNTNCKASYIDAFIKTFEDLYPHYGIKVVFFDIPLWKAFYRNVKRWLFEPAKYVPWKVIRNMHDNYNKINKTYYKQRYI